MKKIILNILPLLLISFVTNVDAQTAEALIAKVVEANGGKDALHQLKDVSFDYTFEVKENKVVDVSKELFLKEIKGFVDHVINHFSNASRLENLRFIINELREKDGYPGDFSKL